MNIKQVKKVIFDLDGVILSTDIYHYKAWKKLFKEEIGIEIDEEVKDLVRGVSRPDSLKLLIKKYNLTNIDEAKFNYLLKAKNDYYIEYLDQLDKDAIFDDFENLSKLLKANNIKMIVASASHNSHYILSKLEIIDLFDGIVDVTTLSNSKPNPEIFLKAKELEGDCEKGECLIVEDAQAGIDAAKAAGIKVIAFNNSKQKLYNYDREVKSHKEIIDMITNDQ